MDVIASAKDAGFTTRVYIVGLHSAEQSIARVAHRVRSGGHSIPDADIRRRWPAVHANLTWLAEHADRLDVYTNAVDGSPARLIAHATSGQVTILDPDALSEVTAALTARSASAPPG